MSTGLTSKLELKKEIQDDQSEIEDLSTSDSKVSLPSINIVLEKIEHYQNQQKLSDSQLLLELTQRQPTSSSTQQDGIQTPDSSRNSTPSTYPSNQQQQQQQQYSAYPYQNNNNNTNNSASSASSPYSNFPSVTPNPSANSIISNEDSFNSNSEDLSPMNSSSTLASAKRSESLPNPSTNNTTPLSSITNSSVKQIQLTPKTSQLDTLSRTSSVDSLDSSLKSGSNTPSLVSLDASNFGSKKRTNLPRETIEILNDWILNNMDNPYPSHSQKRLLLEKTGLSNVQLSNWFINKRRRRIFSKLSGNNGQPIKKKRLIDRI